MFLSTCSPFSLSPPPAHSFFIGPLVINSRIFESQAQHRAQLAWHQRCGNPDDHPPHTSGHFAAGQTAACGSTHRGQCSRVLGRGGLSAYAALDPVSVLIRGCRSGLQHDIVVTPEANYKMVPINSVPISRLGSERSLLTEEFFFLLLQRKAEAE